MPGPSISDLLKEARGRLQALDAQMAESRKKEDLGARLERLERSLAETGTRVTTLATQMEGLGKVAGELRKSGEIPADLRARLDRYENAIADLSRRVSGEKDTFVAYRQSVRQLVQATASIKPGDVEGLRKVVEEHLSQYPEREARVKGLEAQLENLQTLQAKLQDLEAAALKSAEGFDERLKAVGKVGEELERMKAGVVKEVGASGAKVERLREQVERLDGQVREVPSLVKKEVDAAMVGALGELWTKTKALEGDVARAKEEAGKLPGVEKEVWAVQARVRGTEEGLQAVRGDLARGREDAAEMKGDLKALRDLPGRLKEFDAFRGDLARTKEDTADLRANLRGLFEVPARLEEVEAVLADLARARGETTELKAELKALHDLPARLEEVEAVLVNFARMGEETARLKTELEALRDMPGRLKEFEILRGDLAKAKDEAVEVKAELRGLRDLPGRLKEFDALRAELARMKEEAADLRADLKALRDLPGRLKDFESRFESAPRLRGVEARLAPLEVVARKLEGRLVEWSTRFPELETKLKQMDAGLQAQRETAEQVRRGESRIEALEKSVVNLAQRGPAGPTAEDLRRQRQSILALLETLRTGYEQKLLAREEYEAIARENRAKIAELDAKIAETGS